MGLTSLNLGFCECDMGVPPPVPPMAPGIVVSVKHENMSSILSPAWHRSVLSLPQLSLLLLPATQAGGCSSCHVAYQDRGLSSPGVQALGWLPSEHRVWI